MLYPLIRLVSALGSPAGQRARLSILIYHRVVPREDPMFPSLACRCGFDVQMRTLARQFNVIPLADAVAGMQAGSLPARAACVTFDDGYADNAEIALPVLLRHRVPATFFVATDFLDGGRMWNDTIIEAVRLTRQPSLDLNELGLGLHEVRTLGERRKLARWLLSALKYVAHEERLARVSRYSRNRGRGSAAQPDDDDGSGARHAPRGNGDRRTYRKSSYPGAARSRGGAGRDPTRQRQARRDNSVAHRAFCLSQRQAR